MSSKKGILFADSYPKLQFSQQSTDQLPWLYINPVEFDGIRIQAELCNPKPEQEDRL